MGVPDETVRLLLGTLFSTAIFIAKRIARFRIGQRYSLIFSVSMMALRHCLRPALPRARHATRPFSFVSAQDTTRGAASQQRHRHRRSRSSSSSSSSSSEGTSSSNDVPKSSQRSGYGGGGGAASYSIRESGAATTTIRDRVRMIPLGGGVVHVLLSRPDKLNSLDLPMFESIAEAAHILRTDPSWSGNLRAVVMSGEGRAFCTGLDARGVALSGPGDSLGRLLERPSPYGGEGGHGNLAQDVCYLWRRVCVIIVGRRRPVRC